MLETKTMTEKLTQSYAILKFYENLRPDFILPSGVEIMNPYLDKNSLDLSTRFYHKYYNDSHPRKFIFGINPGRFGGGVTGITFTDTIRFADVCGIANDLQRKAELSSIFIYEVIQRYGGPASFYYDLFFSAMSPLGFTKDGLNLNYYDDKVLLKVIEPFIIETILEQKRTIITESDTCFCLGEGTNYKIFQKLNDKHGFFQKIIPLPHPRWIMQYRRKKLEEFAEMYVEKLKGR